MPVAVIVIFLLGLWAFIVWDRGRNIAPLSRETLKHGWIAKSAPRWPAFIGLSTVCASLGVVSWLNPSHPPFTGRLSIVFMTVYANFGSNGIAYLWALIAILLAVFALLTWRSSIAGTPSNTSK